MGCAHLCEAVCWLDLDRLPDDGCRWAARRERPTLSTRPACTSLGAGCATAAAERRRGAGMTRFLLPLGIFLALAVALAAGLSRDPRALPSPLVGKAAPAFELPLLEVEGRTL